MVHCCVLPKNATNTWVLDMAWACMGVAQCWSVPRRRLVLQKLSVTKRPWPTYTLGLWKAWNVLRAAIRVESSTSRATPVSVLLHICSTNEVEDVTGRPSHTSHFRFHFRVGFRQLGGELGRLYGYSQIFPDAFVHFCAHCIEAIWFGSRIAESRRGTDRVVRSCRFCLDRCEVARWVHSVWFKSRGR